MILATNSIIK